MNAMIYRQKLETGQINLYLKKGQGRLKQHQDK